MYAISCSTEFRKTYYCASYMNNITFISLDNNWPFKDFNFLALYIITPIMPYNDMVNIVYSIHMYFTFTFKDIFITHITMYILALIPTICMKTRICTNVLTWCVYILKMLPQMKLVLKQRQ